MTVMTFTLDMKAERTSVIQPKAPSLLSKFNNKLTEIFI